MEHHAGRTWRNLEDTAVAAQLLYFAPEQWTALRRGTDFYPEGQLLWLEVDARIRKRTQGKKSLDDFCSLFFGGPSGPPREEGYTFDQLVKALEQVVSDDWRGLLRERLTSHSALAPTGGIEASGWRLVYGEQMPDMVRAKEAVQQRMELMYSLGVSLDAGPDDRSGRVVDVAPGLPAEKAGLRPGMKVVAVNTRKWSPDVLRAALREAKTSAKPIELLIENEEEFATRAVDYHGGERYPRLERIPGTEDGLAAILRPREP
jgi:predicted metalloprotease with PDZ domain